MPLSNSHKVVLPELLDTWTLGPRFVEKLTDLGPAKEGEAVDVPTADEGTVNTTESASPEAVTLGTDAFLCDRTKFINTELKHRDTLQLMDGRYKEAVMQARLARMWTAVQRDLVEYWIKEVATAAADHVNVAGDAITDDDVNAWDALHAEQAGVDSEARLILASPSAVAAFKNTAAYAPFQANPGGNLGLGNVGSINEIPLIQYKGVPGNTSALGVAVTGVTVSSNVATGTVPAGHNLKVGQLVYTSGLTTDVPKASATAILSSAATEVTFALTASNGALADGEGTIYSASGMALLLHLPWCFFASDSYSKNPEGAGLMPDMTIVDRSDAAGQALKIVTHIGRICHAGAVKVLHTPLAA